MSREHVERAARVYVPKALYDQLVAQGMDEINDYILDMNSRMVTDLFAAAGLVESGSDMPVTFVPVEELDEDSLVRKVKFIEVFRNREDEITDARISWKDIDVDTLHEN